MSTQEQPNVIFILSDDQGPWAAHCYGNEEIRTPNLDRLAASGVLFENFFCTSPVCSPARASLLTGRIPSSHGVHDFIRAGNMGPDAIAYLDGYRCYTDVLAEHGWQCGLSGKWHLGDSLRPGHGFSHWFSHPAGAGSYNDHSMIRNGKVESTKGYVTDLITDDAISFIEESSERPFYLSVHYTAPHSPWSGHPKEIVDSYESCLFRSCPQEPQHPWAGPLTLLSYNNREFLKGYFAAVTAMDFNIGRILDAVERLSLRERTLIVFTSDNGFSCGQHGFWGKGNGTFPINMYDNSVKVPMIVSQPGRIPIGRRTQAMMSQYDFTPTLLHYLGLEHEIDDRLPGKSFRRIWEGEVDDMDRDVFVLDEYGPVRMIRTREWKYIHRYPFGVHELYCLTTDPGELHNRIDDDSCLPILRELRGRLATWFATYVTPDLDGRTLPVTGSGQLKKIEHVTTGQDCFSDDRLEANEIGFPQVKHAPDLEAFKKATHNTP